MKLSAILAPMIAAGVPGDVILATVRAFEDERADLLEKRRESDRLRQSAKKSRDSREPSTKSRDRLLVTRADDAPGLENKQTNKEERKKDSAAKPRGDLDAFKSQLSSILDIERIDALVAVRRKKGATFSAHAGSLLVAALAACPNVSAAADEMVLRNWTSIKPEWLQSRSHHPSAPPSRLRAMQANSPGLNFNEWD